MWHWESSLVLCDDLEVCDGRGRGRLNREKRYIIVTDLHCCTAETNTVL